MRVRSPSRRNDDPLEPVEWEEDAPVDLGYGSITQLIEYNPPKRKIKRRPIGYLADIDTFIED